MTFRISKVEEPEELHKMIYHTPKLHRRDFSKTQIVVKTISALW